MTEAPGRAARWSQLARNAAAAAVRRERDRRFVSRLRFDASTPVAVLSPHFDDAVLNCWSVLSAPAPTVVLNVFAGVPAPGFVSRWDALCGASDSAAHALARRREDAEALALAGRTPVNLDLLEAEHRGGRPRRSLAEIDAAIAPHLAATSLLYAPAGLAPHVDHRTLRAFARGALRAGVPVRLYAEVPYAVVHGWPTWVTGEPPEPHRDVDVFWRDLLSGVPELGAIRAAEVVRLDDARADEKLAALRAYGTQLPALDGGAARRVSRASVRRFEVFWALGDELEAVEPDRFPA